MANYNDLSGAFNSLIDTLTNRLSPFFDAVVSGRWLGAMGRTAAIARETARWTALPDPVPGGGLVVSSLDAATRAIAVAAPGDSDTAILAALVQADGALEKLEKLLGMN